MNIFSLVCVPRLSCCRGLRISSTDETRGSTNKRLQYVICMPSGVWFHELKSSLTFIWLFFFLLFKVDWGGSVFVSIESMKITRDYIGHNSTYYGPSFWREREIWLFVLFISFMENKQSNLTQDQVNRKKFCECHELSLSPSRPLQ